MARAKYKLETAAGIPRVVLIDPNATVGATLGTDVRTPDGAVGTPATVRAWLGVEAAGSGGGVNAHRLLTGLTVGNDHPQYTRRDTLTTRGDIYVRDATNVVRLGLGATGQVLTSNGSDALWSTLPTRVITVEPGLGIDVDDYDPEHPVVSLEQALYDIILEAVPYDALADVAFTGDYADLYGTPVFPDFSATTIVTQADETATLPASFRLVAGSNVTLTPGTNTLTISATGGGGGGVTDVLPGLGIDVDDSYPSTPVVALESALYAAILSAVQPGDLAPVAFTGDYVDLYGTPDYSAITFLTQADETATFPASLRLVAGANVTLTPGANTLTIASSGGGGGGITIVPGDGILVDDYDPANPIVSVDETYPFNWEASHRWYNLAGTAPSNYARIELDTTSALNIDVFDAASVTFYDVLSAESIGDAYYSSVASLLHFDGADGSTTFTDEKGITWSANGDAQLDDAQKRFGSASLRVDGTGDSIQAADDTTWEMGSGDFTIELWVRFATTPPVNCRWISKWTDSGNQREWALGTLSSGNMRFSYSTDGSSSTTRDSSWTPTINTWHHVCAMRSGSNVYLFADGTLLGSHAIGTIFSGSSVLMIGAGVDSGVAFNGWIDEVRVTKGVARYPTIGFSPPTAAFPAGIPTIVLGDLDTNTVIRGTLASNVFQPGLLLETNTVVIKHPNDLAGGLFINNSDNRVVLFDNNAGSDQGGYMLRNQSGNLTLYTTVDATPASTTGAGTALTISRSGVVPQVFTVYTGGSASFAINADKAALFNGQAGSVGQVLTSAGSGAAPAWTTLGTVGSLVAEATVTGAAATTLVVSGLSLTADKTYLIRFIGENAAGSTATLSMFFNGDTTVTNYNRIVESNGGSGTQANNAQFASMTANDPCTIYGTLTLDFDGKARLMSDSNYDTGANISTQRASLEWTTAATVTSITISSSVASALAIGTKIQVLELMPAVMTALTSVQAADLTKVNNTFTDTDLQFNLTAGTYAWDFVTRDLCHATPDCRTQLSYSGTVTSVGIMGQNYASTGTITAEAGTALPHTWTRASTSEGGSWASGTLVVADAGVLKIQFAQVTTSAGNPVIFRAGSWMRVTRLT